MKNVRIQFLFALAMAGILVSCGSNDASVASAEAEGTSAEYAAPQVPDSTTIQWLDSTTQELGKAKEGQVMEISWRFKNAGDKPLIFSDVRAGCGCTVADKPEHPIAPGEEGVIKAKFDTKGQLYNQHKSLYVRANNRNKNALDEDILAFKVEVEKQ